MGIPMLSGRPINNITVSSGNNVINHGLGHQLQGYFVTSMSTAFAQLYLVPSTNPTLQMTLHSNTTAVINLWVW
jgi:hypothetical protein